MHGMGGRHIASGCGDESEVWRQCGGGSEGVEMRANNSKEVKSTVRC